MPSGTAARQLSAAIWTGAPDAAVRPSPITHAETDIAQSVRPTSVISGWRSRHRNCCRSRTSTWSSRCRMTYRRSFCRTRRLLYDLLFRASAETLLEVAADPEHLGADIGFLSVLHTWGQNLLQNPHS